MKRINVYLKLRVLGAIDPRADNSIKSRIQEVSKMTFHDEDGTPHVFTWRTIQTNKGKPEASDATAQD